MDINFPVSIRIGRFFERVYPLTFALGLISLMWAFANFVDYLFDPPGATVKTALSVGYVAPLLSLIASILMRRRVPVQFLERYGETDVVRSLLTRAYCPLTWGQLLSAAEGGRKAAIDAARLEAQRQAAGQL